jgi:uncharacterized SAM-binding protein YcdF (DUF218 family)
MRIGLVARGVPPARVLCELKSLSTFGNARHSAPLLRRIGVARVGLVTCDWHMARALRCFRAVGIEAEAFPAPSPPQSPLTRGVRGLRERVRWWVSRGRLLGGGRVW